MSKRLTRRIEALEKAANTPDDAKPLTYEMEFEAGQIVKASVDGEVAFVGTFADAQAHAFVITELTALTDDELARYAIVTQQTTLGMGNIIDVVING